MVRCRAQRRGQRTLGRFHDFSRSLSGVGAPNYGISAAARGLVSLRMGITQYSEVSAEYASLLVENYTNALRSVRKYDLEFFQPLAAPPNNHKTSKNAFLRRSCRRAKWSSSPAGTPSTWTSGPRPRCS